MPPAAEDSETPDRFAAYRREFPVSKRWVYLNHAGVAPTSLRFQTAVNAHVRELVEEGAASAGDGFAAWRGISTVCRQRFAKLIGCEAREVALIKNTSHGLALVARGIDWRAGDRVAVARGVEYPSNVHPWRHLRRSHGLDVAVDEIVAADGVVTTEAVERALTPRTRLVTVSAAQFGSGAVTALAPLGELCRQRDVRLCVDGIQTVGALPIDVKKLGIDYLAADSHKWMLGAMGIGALFVDESRRLTPALLGWKSMIDAWQFNAAKEELKLDAGRFEEGSPAYAMIAGFSAALELLGEFEGEEIAQRIRSLVDQAAAGLEALGCEVGPPPAYRHHILCFRHSGVEPEVLVDSLRRHKILVAQRQGRVRVSPHFYNTEEEIAVLIDAVAEILAERRRAVATAPQGGAEVR